MSQSIEIPEFTPAEIEQYYAELTPEEKKEFDALISSPANRYCPQTPTARQALFLSLKSEREVFYGGAAGGAKSSALLMAALEDIAVPNYAALLLRRTYADLAKPGALMDRASSWLRNSPAKWSEQKKQWTFPGGAKLAFGHLDNENDKFAYQSSEFQFIGFDELSQFSETQYLYLFSRLRRLTKSNVQLRMRSASNPGGVGAEWVQQRFIPEDFSPERAGDVKVWWKEGVDDSGRDYKRAFVPARLSDNPHLDQQEYLGSLHELDDVTQRQLVEGDWTIRKRGNILTPWNERHHVISWSEFERVYMSRRIPPNWLLSCYQDWGTTPEHPCVTTWFATAPENAPFPGLTFVYRGLVVHDKTVRQVAGLIGDAMAVDGERARVTRWRMSHEASSERLAYRREHGFGFESWKTGRTRGIAQLRNALEVVGNEAHPFRPELTGRSKVYFIVADEELAFAKTDAGLARWRAEIPAYHWDEQKSGEPKQVEVPYALFNDAVDTLRAAAADYWPRSLEKTIDEKIVDAMPEQSRPENIKARSPLPKGLTPELQLEVEYERAKAMGKVKSSRVYFDENLRPINLKPRMRYGYD